MPSCLLHECMWVLFSSSAFQLYWWLSCWISLHNGLKRWGPTTQQHRSSWYSLFMSWFAHVSIKLLWGNLHNKLAIPAVGLDWSVCIPSRFSFHSEICDAPFFILMICHILQHSGLSDVNPGHAVRMDNGECIAQWRKLYLQKFGVRHKLDSFEMYPWIVLSLMWYLVIN